jgi:ADP-dependent NAD(P)H-hydrate dehydratase / NAD(P)H-hydrate epimerase
MEHTYWRQQQPDKPLFPDIAWSRPEQRAQAGRLGVIGGNKLGFAGIAEAYSVALKTGTGEVRVLLPDALRKTIPPSITEAVFGATNSSGSLSRDALGELHALGAWSSGVLLAGDASRNSETAIVYEEFIRHLDKPLTVTRDAIDLLKNSSQALVERPDTLLVASFAQLQKLLQLVYYPKVLTFSMQLSSLVEALHKFTITYPITLAVLHRDHILIAHGGEVISTRWENPMAIWRGSVAAKAASYWLWNPTKPLEAVATSLIDTN